MAIDARYLPEVKRPWIHVASADLDEWDAYREAFDPTIALTTMGWTAEEVGRAADRLLFGLSRREPCRGEWSMLIRHAAQKSWDSLHGDQLAALDARIAAEILLLFYEDLVAVGRARPLSECKGWFHTEQERLSYTAESLDGTLASLGLSPHPGAVLVVEGETEEVLLRHIRDRLMLSDDAGIVRTVVMRGTKKDLTKLVAFAAGPLIESGRGDDWLLVKPVTRVLVVVDPDAPFDSPDNVEEQRTLMISEIEKVVRAQGVVPAPEDLADLVRISTWTGGCFEFAHFDDAELATALAVVHPDCGGLSRSKLVHALAQHRHVGDDIKRVWARWRPKPSKQALATALWPCLEQKIAAAEHDPEAPVPEIVERLLDAQDAAARPAGRWVLRGSSIQL